MHDPDRLGRRMRTGKRSAISCSPTGPVGGGTVRRQLGRSSRSPGLDKMSENMPQRPHVPRNSGSYGTWMLQVLFAPEEARFPYCQQPMDKAKHTIFDCSHWESMRLAVNGFIGN